MLQAFQKRIIQLQDIVGWRAAFYRHTGKQGAQFDGPCFHKIQAVAFGKQYIAEEIIQDGSGLRLVAGFYLGDQFPFLFIRIVQGSGIHIFVPLDGFADFGLLGQDAVIQLQLFLALIDEVAEQVIQQLVNVVDHFRSNQRNGAGFLKKTQGIVNIQVIFPGQIGYEERARFIHEERAEQDGT